MKCKWCKTEVDMDYDPICPARESTGRYPDGKPHEASETRETRESRAASALVRELTRA